MTCVFFYSGQKITSTKPEFDHDNLLYIVHSTRLWTLTMTTLFFLLRIFSLAQHTTPGCS